MIAVCFLQDFKGFFEFHPFSPFVLADYSKIVATYASNFFAVVFSTSKKEDEAMEKFIFERCFVWYVSRQYQELGMNHSQFAALIFPNHSSPSALWRATRNGVNDKFRGLSLEDCLACAEVLSMDIESLFWNVRQTLKSGWTLAQDVKNESTEKGRPRKQKTKE